MKIWLKVIALGGLLGTFFHWTTIFLRAYFNPTKSVVVFINKFNEANLEFFLLIFFFIIIVFWVIDYLKN